MRRLTTGAVIIAASIGTGAAVAVDVITLLRSRSIKVVGILSALRCGVILRTLTVLTGISAALIRLRALLRTGAAAAVLRVVTAGLTLVDRGITADSSSLIAGIAGGRILLIVLSVLITHNTF